MSSNCFSDSEIVNILHQIDGIFDIASIDEVGVVVAAPESPCVVHVNEKLGIAHTVIKPMFKYVIGQLGQLDASIGNDPVQLAAHCKIVNSITRMLLLIKGDFPLAYKLRKQMIESNLSTITSEIETIVLIFGRTPKTPSGWYHRRWCLTVNAQRKGRLLLTAPEIESERELCRRFAESSPKNYYCWMHRLWLLDHMSDSQLIDELSFTHEWLISHVSDHSACSHRIHVIYLLTRRLLRSTASELPSQLEGYNPAYSAPHEHALSFLVHCLQTSSALICRRPGHEALWYHRRSLLVFIVHLTKAVLAENWPVAKEKRVVEKGNCFEPNCDTLNPLNADVSCAAEQSNVLSALISLISSHRNPEIVQQVPSWLYLLLQSETSFCRSCVVNQDVWDYAAQKAMALRYSVFMLDVVRQCLDSMHRVVDVKVLDVASIIRSMIVDDGDTSGDNLKEMSVEDLHSICCRSYSILSPFVQNSSAVYRS